jgi:hypothetical protein
MKVLDEEEKSLTPFINPKGSGASIGQTNRGVAKYD